MPTFATITGRITIPGTDIGIRAEVTATPLTTDNVVIDTDRTNWGPAAAETKSDGTLTDLKIPLGVAPVGVLWRITVKPLDKRASLQPWTVGIFDITGSTTLQALALNGVDVTAVDVTFREDIFEARDSAATSATSSAASATSAAASASLARSIAEIAVPDDVVAALVADPDSQTNAALSVLAATSGDQTARINAFLAATPSDVKRLIGAFTVSGTLTFPHSDATLDLSAATITTTVANATVIAATGDRATVKGGRIVSPATWDGTNSTWTYAVVLMTGADSTARGVRLTNVPRVGIGVKDASGTSRVLGCTIDGNYPAASWTEVETMHFGIAHDPGTSSSKLIASGNTIRSCVQGMFMGNFGTGAAIGSIVQRNTFEGCHNHCVYGSAGISDALVSFNTGVDCSRPIAMTGPGHDVSHNDFTTTLPNGNLSEACGIQLRDAVDCTVSHNRMKGSVHNTVPAIDLVRTGTNTVLTGNQVIGNKVEITGPNTGVAIRVGSGAETTFFGNTVALNKVKGQGLPNQGLISFFGANGSQGYGNKCIENNVTITGPCHGIYISEQRGPDVNGNHIRLEYDAPDAVTLGAIAITENSIGTKARNNDIECTSSYGANVTFRGIYELAAAGAGGRYGSNRFSFDLTKLAAGVTHVIQGTSGSILDEALPGAPTTVCGPGSTWRRTDGGASTALYVKESAASSDTWRAV